VTALHDAPLGELAPQILYRILRLRVAVFVVEQNCPYAELDGRDLEPDARQVWAERDGQVVSTLRLLHDRDGRVRIGRVATAPNARGSGIAAELMRRAIRLAGPVEIVLEAQAHLQGWYARFGFVRDGEQYLEDGIAHVPMRRAIG
jgi:ElaA protein